METRISFLLEFEVIPVLKKIGMKFLQSLDAELAHDIALLYLRANLPVYVKTPHYPKLETSLAGLKISNPIGLAAGFDKNGVGIKSLSQLGFGFTEIGAVTPHPQPGNTKPRVFRLKREKAIINHYGFNNDGMIKINSRLQKYDGKSVVGLNIGANKNSLDMKDDFSKVLTYCGNNINFATINISSPNTKHLRDFHSEEKLAELLSKVVATNNSLPKALPIFIKISPDLQSTQLEKIVSLTHQYRLAGIIATNTSTDYKLLNNKRYFSKGGISGVPLFCKSTRILAQLSIISEGKIELIGVGGVSSGADAFTKICAGASVVQLYSALTFHGPSLVASILKELNTILSVHGYSNVSEAIGCKKIEYAST
jgi:dihydroorotate dehydrogenase